ncbi:MAG: methyltetrahydrofolate cobalamin methyltransferase [Treponema sp.]|jgi:5-methyltetrahydrofolate--homocysteine methyltransferase|nr:methyltetrahydrofolate cobalamin methyltransferase [Treponema sp.]
MIIVGEKINGSIPSVARAIAEKNADLIRSLAQKQSDAGAAFIDVCASVPGEEEMEVLAWLIGLVQEVTETPIAIDSPNAKHCAQAIPLCKKPGLVNSVSGEGTKIEDVFPVISGTDWKCIALLCGDSGIPKNAEHRLTVLETIIKKAEAYRIPTANLYIDPLVEMLCTSENGIEVVTSTIKKVKERCADIHVIGAASNVSFNLPARKYINQGFIILAIQAGMDSAILDPLNKDMRGLIYAAEALLGQDEFCMEYIGAFRAGLFGTEVKPAAGGNISTDLKQGG